jgi:hypothetical protein
MTDFDYFNAVLTKLNDGWIDKSIVITEKNVHPTDKFLILGAYGHKSITITFENLMGLIWVAFDGEDAMLLENCPTSFYKTLLKNM